jgi:soluble lytic murein transglycosylase
MQVQRFRAAFFIPCLVLAALACNLPGVVGITSTPTASETPPPTATSTPTATATPDPAFYLNNAELAGFNGDWDQAQAQYQTAQNVAGNPADVGAAQLGLGATFLQQGRYQEAEAAIDSFLNENSEHESVANGYFLRAEALEALGRHAEAAQDYSMYLVVNPGVLDAYVSERMGDAFFAAQDYPSAIEAYQDALASFSVANSLQLEIKIGRVLAASADHESAIEKFRMVYEQTEDVFTKAQMDYLIGRSFIQLGDSEQAYMHYLDAVNNYPRAYDSYSGLVELVDNGIPVNELNRGLVDYYAGQYGVAIAAFDRYLSAFPVDHDGTVHYYKGLALRALEEYNGALLEWDVLIETHPMDELWDDAWEEIAFTRWAYLDQHDQAAGTLLTFVELAPDHTRASEFLFDAGRAYERAGELEEAAVHWEQVAAAYPSSPWAYRSLFLAGIAYYRLEKWTEAAEVFQNSLGYVRSEEDRAASYLWMGKVHQVLGDLEPAQAAWNLAEEADPSRYYGLRAADLIAGRDPFRSTGIADFDYDLEAERIEAEEWMRTTFSVPESESLFGLNDELRMDPRMIRGRALMELGQLGDAKAEFESLRSSYADDAVNMYRLMNEWIELGMYQPAIYASRQIMRLAGMDEQATRYAPDYIKHIRFGPYFNELVFPEALRHDLDSLFIFSVIRQESLFEGFATSYAAARGLMQIIPSTGQAIADQLGWPAGYTTDDLYRPVVSVRLGTQYLSDQRDLFDGDLFAALAAYNAGPGNALIWYGLAGGDPDLFLEVIRIGQPQDYIRVIYWAYTNYQDLYRAN